MIYILKDRNETEELQQFLKNFNLDDNVYVPFLYDGVLESCLAKNNQVFCRPANSMFESMWKILTKKPELLSMFLKNANEIEHQDEMFHEVIKTQKSDLLISYNLLNMCRRSNSNTLLGKCILEKKQTFTPKYLYDMKRYKPPFQIVTKNLYGGYVFQDLTYLDSDEISFIKEQKKYLLTTNKKNHLYMFANAECSMIGEYYLIWK